MNGCKEDNPTCQRLLNGRQGEKSEKRAENWRKWLKHLVDDGSEERFNKWTVCIEERLKFGSGTTHHILTNLDTTTIYGSLVSCPLFEREKDNIFF
jgi:hypothetical protein